MAKSLFKNLFNVNSKKADMSYLSDPKVFSVGAVDAHSDHAFYDCTEAYESGVNSLRMSLNGT